MKSLITFLVAVLVCGFVACGEKTKESKPKEKKVSHLGTYNLDTKALTKSLEDMQKQASEGVVGVDEDEEESASNQMQETFGNSTGTLVLKEENAFEVEAMVGPIPIKAKGTYKVEEDKIVLTVTEQEGDEFFKIEGMKGTIKDGVINIERDASVLIPLTLRRS